MSTYYDRYPPRRQNPLAYLWPVLLLVLVAGFLIWRFWPQRGGDTHDPAAEARPITPRGPLSEMEQSVINVYRRSKDSVVHVTTLREQTRPYRLNPQRIPQGTGSGFIWDEQGRVVTNYHVIRPGNVYYVQLADHSVWPASLVGFDADTDLAVLQIRNAPKDRLKPIPIGESHNLEVGQYAFAIGNPFGLDQTFAPGFISALNREIDNGTGTSIRGVIQTTAPINPGNSGGPLLDSYGRLIGVNTAIYSPTGAWAGIGFAVPVDEVQRVVPQLIRSGSVRRVSLGISEVPDHVARQQPIARQLARPGVVIWHVPSRGAAEQAKLVGMEWDRSGNVVLGDVIVAIDQRPTRSCQELKKVLQEYQVGQTVTLTLQRGTERRYVQIRLEEEDALPAPHSPWIEFRWLLRR
jgi:S1-C subfamily serine protease